MQIFPCRISSWRPTGATREQPAAASSCVCDSVSCCSQVCRVRSAASSNGQYSNARCAGKAAYNEEMSRSFPGLFYDFVWMDFRLSVDKTAKRLTSTNIAKQKNTINRLAAKVISHAVSCFFSSLVLLVLRMHVSVMTVLL